MELVPVISVILLYAIVVTSNTMILCLVFLYLLGGSTATNSTRNTTGGTGSSCISKSIMCRLMGNLDEFNSELVNLQPKDIPRECDIIIYSRFSVNRLSVINVDEAVIKSLVDLNKPVLLDLHRDDMYADWGVVLDSKGNTKETKILCDFAKRVNISGFIIDDLTPQCSDASVNEKVGKFIVPYANQLKCNPDFIIGVAVEALGSTIKNPSIFNFAELNNLVTFYEIKTSIMNPCKPKIYNGQTPITKVDHGANYMLGMEEVALFLKESNICPTIITYDIELIPVDMSSESQFDTYLQVCKGKLNCSASCIQTTTNFYNKGKFVHEQDSGLIVMYIDLDDTKNDCGCNSAFAGFKNIVAGFRGGSQTSCSKFDVQSTEYKFK